MVLLLLLPIRNEVYGYSQQPHDCLHNIEVFCPKVKGFRNWVESVWDFHFFQAEVDELHKGASARSQYRIPQMNKEVPLCYLIFVSLRLVLFFTLGSSFALNMKGGNFFALLDTQNNLPYLENAINCKNAATAVNKEAVVNSMLSNQFVQHQLHMPSLATHDSLDLLESSSRFVKRKREPTEDPNTSQVLPEAKSKKVKASIGADHRKQL
ncbi:hypothetical protein Tco_0608755 [Tanacetum coccineum]